MDGNPNIVGQHFLRTPDGVVYGPVDMVTLCGWATDARVIPGCVVSVDQATWTAVESIPELRLNWLVRLPDGSSYGPLNLLAIWALAQEDSLHPGLTVIEKATQRKVVLNATLLPLLIEESRHMLTAGGRLAAEMLATLKAERETAFATASDRERQVTALREALAAAERQLADNVRLVGKTQRYLAEQEQAAKIAAERAREATRLNPELEAARLRLMESDKREQDIRKSVEEIRSQSAAAGQEAAALRAELAETRIRLEASEKQLREAGQSLEGVRSRAEQLEREATLGRTELVETRQRFEDAERRRQDALNSLREMQSQGDTETREAAGLHVALAETQQRMEESEERRRESEKNLEEARAREGELAQERTRICAELAETRHRLDESETRCEAASESLKRIQSQAEQLGRETTNTRSELTLTKTKLEASERHGRETGETLKDMQSRIEELGRQAVDARAELALTLTKLEESESRGQEVRRQLTDVQSRQEESVRMLETLRTRIASDEELQRDTSARLEVAQRDAEAMKAALGEVVEREQASNHAHAAEVGRLNADVARLTMELDRERAEWAAGEKEKDATIIRLRGELAQWDARIQALLVDVGRVEAVLQAREDEFTAFRHEAERREAELTARVAAAKKDADAATRRVQEIEDLRERAARELVQARERSAVIEKGLREELAGVQRDLSGMLMAADCVRLAVEEQQSPKAAPINWMDQAQESARVPKGPSATEQLDLLNRKMRASAEEKDALRKALDDLRSGHEELKRKNGEQTAALQQQIKASTALLQQALEETERREGQLRALRKKAEERERELLERIEQIEAAQRETVVVEPEVLAPGVAWERPVEGAGEAEGAPQAGLDLLNTVEAQLRAELKKWEALSQGSANGKTKKWFGRKQS